MKKILKIFLESLVIFFETIVSLIDVFCFGHPFLKNKKLNKNSDSVSILANGPSAREIINNNPELLTRGDLVSMNDAATSEVFFRLQPSYYILLDPAYFGGSWLGDKELTDNSFDLTLKRINENLLKVDWEMTLLLPSSKNAEEFADRFNGHQHISVVRYNASRIQGFECYKMWAYKKGLGVPSSRNIIIPAILLMINAGYKKVYLYGAEFSWTKYMDIDLDNGLMYMNDRHYYSKDQIRYYDKGGYRLMLLHIAEMLGGLESISKYARQKKVSVINRTKGSFIDAFDYENPDTIEKKI